MPLETGSMRRHVTRVKMILLKKEEEEEEEEEEQGSLQCGYLTTPTSTMVM